MSEPRVGTAPKITWLVGATLLLTWLWCFRGPLFSSEVMALRDAGNFYYPLFYWQCEQWSQGQVPLWNPLDGLGTPHFADATSSLFYPGKAIFVLPLSFELRFNLYLAAHVLLAAAASYWTARRWNASSLGAGVCALSYAFGGYVLSQHCNVVFLVSAAWLPLGFYFADGMIRRRSPRKAIGLAAVLALMVYGGDPQTAYHLGLLTAVYAAIARLSRAAVTENTNQDGLPATTPAWWRWRPVLLCLTAVSSFGFAAAQVLPAAQWARQSERVVSDLPRNVFEIWSYARIARQPGKGQRLDLGQAVTRGLFQTPAADTHARHAYYYSLGPWRWLELVWPNFYGRSYPTHQRWLFIIPAEGRTWTPTLYGGLIPLLAALGMMRWKDNSPQTRWLIVCVVVGLAASLGWYGLGWLVQELRTIAGRGADPPGIGQPVGGLYWLLTTLLPGYAYFRFPAKWFVFAAVALSLLSAKGFDRLLAGDQRIRKIAGAIAAASFVGALAVVVCRGLLLGWLQNAPSDVLYGPFDAHRAWLATFLALLQSGVLAGVVWFVMDWDEHRRVKTGALLLMATAAELVIANHWVVATVPAKVMHVPSRAATVVDATRDDHYPPRIFHVHRPDTRPEWRRVGSPSRLAEIVQHERNFLLQRYHLMHDIASIDAPLSVRSAAWSHLMQRARRSYLLGEQATDRSFIDSLDIDYVITAQGTQPFTQSNSGRVALHERAQPSSTRDDSSDGTNLPQSGNAVITKYSLTHVEIECDLRRPATLVLADNYDSDWTATTLPTGGSVIVPLSIQAGLIRTVELPPGRQTVFMDYKPRLLRLGSLITIASLSIAALAFGFASWKQRATSGRIDRSAPGHF